MYRRRPNESLLSLRLLPPQLVNAAPARRRGPPAGGAERDVGAFALAGLEEVADIGVSVCPYCAVGCSTLMYAKVRRLIHVEGNPDSPINEGASRGSQNRWLMSSDVCKHCDPAPCLEACPTGSIFRTEFDTVVVQHDICNGCGYCVPACPSALSTSTRSTAKRTSEQCASAT